MPIFMDRHDLSDTVTAENIAHLHQKDLNIQHQFECRGLTYWFDGKRKTAFCLIEAPDKDAIRKMHDLAHGDVPNSIIEVDAGIVESFLGRIEDPEKAQTTGLNIINEPAFRIILLVSVIPQALTDASVSAFGILSEDFGMPLLKIIKDKEGSTVKCSDDQMLVSFRSVSLAAAAAFEIHALFRERNKQKIPGKAGLKIGLNAGVPVTKKQLLFEDAIRLVERICEMAKGEIIASAEVMDLFHSENADGIPATQHFSALTQADEKFITLFMDFLEKSWNDTNLQVDHFSKPVGCSKSQLYRKMILLTGKSPNTFILEYRLKEAVKLLRKGAGNISEIAFETGFSSPSYFTKCFKKQFGILPAGYLSSRHSPAAGS